MAEVLVVVDHVDGVVRKTTTELLTLARRIGDPTAVFFGSRVDTARDTLARFGATKIKVVDAPELDTYLVVPHTDALVHIARESSPAAILLPSTAQGKEVAARTAVRLDSGLITDAVDVAADGTTTQSVFAASYLVTAKVTRGIPVITVKANAVTPEEASATPEVDMVSVAFDVTNAPRIQHVEPRARSERPDLSEAEIVVSGGRGVGGAEGFGVVEALADALGGAVGASRAAVDASWYPHTFQVGQTGTSVSPQLYVAAGISGAIQHRAGMQTSKTIVAVNKDPEAPIFDLVDFGIVGDLFEVLPQLTAAIAERKG